MDLSAKEIMGCLKSLNMTEARLRISQVEEAFGSTYGWLFKERVGFEDWLSGATSNTIFWIQGKPGSGKSTAMKFAMRHKRTVELLRRHCDTNWIIAGFFFHDRGSQIQKSIEGLLQEILYQILVEHQDLIRRMLQHNPRSLERVLKQDDANTENRWTIEEVQDALNWVIHHAELSLCLFIDALDEYHGQHRNIISTIQNLEKFTKVPTFHLRLCLASRSGNAFLNAFQGCPGFIMQEKTKLDIMKYIAGHLKVIAKDNLAGVRSLCWMIVDKAQGVFIWVKIVTNELLDGFENGDTIEELRGALRNMPYEVSELYERMLKRIQTKYKREAYILFSLAISTNCTWTIKSFLDVAIWWLTKHYNRSFDTPDTSQELAQMQRRLNNRCAGLLETVHAKDHKDIYVQFIHQTAKEYLSNGGALALLIEDELPPFGNGHFFAFCYWFNIRLQDKLAGVSNASSRAIHYHMVTEARMAEKTLGISVLDHIEEALYGRCRFLEYEDAEWVLTTALSKKDTESILRCLFHSDMRLSSLFVAITWFLPNSIKQRLKDDPDVTRQNSGALVHAVVLRHYEFDLGHRLKASSGFEDDQFHMIMHLLAEHGISPDSDYRHESPISYILQFPRILNSFNMTNFQTIAGLLKHGADPNQLVYKFRQPLPLLSTILAMGRFNTSQGLLTLVEMLCEKGADVRKIDAQGFMPLYYSLRRGYFRCDEILLRYGADPCRIHSSGICVFAPSPHLLAKIWEQREDLPLSYADKQLELFASWIRKNTDKIQFFKQRHDRSCIYAVEKAVENTSSGKPDGDRKRTREESD